MGNQPTSLYVPLMKNGAAPFTGKLTIDPVTRIEGHLRLDIQATNGFVSDAWSAGTAFRGLELVLKDRDPREAWIFAQRVCGVCTTVHALASVRAVENAVGIVIPDNARIIRNLMEASQFIHDHVIHFYHLHALDWVDIVNGLRADPAATSALAEQNNPGWANNGTAYFQGVQTRLANIASSGQLGFLGQGYWGHPAYKLSPEANLLFSAHYLEALEWQSQFVKFQALLGGKNPHPQVYLVGGMATPVDNTLTAELTINAAVIAQLRSRLIPGASFSGLDFITKVYFPDLLLLASQYKEWAALGAGYKNFLAYGDFPLDNNGRTNLLVPSGVIYNGDLTQVNPLDPNQIREFITHSWYDYSGGSAVGLHPAAGETTPNYTGPQPPYTQLDTQGKYSWIKSPRYLGHPMEVGPLARIAIAYAAGRTAVRTKVDAALASLGLPQTALFSTLGRILARGLETVLLAEQMPTWLTQLETNMNTNDTNINKVHNGTNWNMSTWPSQPFSGLGLTEAPRGALGHWVKIKPTAPIVVEQERVIESYQMVVPTTWNGSPRDAQGQRGPWEEALIGTPTSIPSQPLEILRTVHSFDPCVSCAIHVIDTKPNPGLEVSVENPDHQ